MFCLDTYALVEIAVANPKFTFLIREDYVIASTTFAEFYWVLLREKGKETAAYWADKLRPYVQEVTSAMMLKAMEFRLEHKPKNLSFFDCAGYIFSREQGYIFVTGDKEFRDFQKVRFIQK